MQKIIGLMRRAIDDYSLIEDGDRIAVCVSGGKDSVVMLAALCKLRQFLGQKFDLFAVTVDPCFFGKPCNYTPIMELCKNLGVPYTVKTTDIWSVVFDIRREKNPCSLCARMRRGILHDAARELHCNKIALGHHNDDVIETFFMNMFNEGRLGTFSPKSYLSRKDITMIRPMVLASESVIKASAAESGLPVVKSICPVDKTTDRTKMRQFIEEQTNRDKSFKKKIFTAIRGAGIFG